MKRLFLPPLAIAVTALLAAPLQSRAQTVSAKTSSGVTAFPVSEIETNASGMRRAAIVDRISRKEACA